MYSVVLMMALSGGAAEAPDFCHRAGCWKGCMGCYSGCHGCFTTGCHGCFGGCFKGCFGGCFKGCFGGCFRGGLFGKKFGCHGCHGCYGYHGCYTACHGCYNGCACYSYGCHGCAGYPGVAYPQGQVVPNGMIVPEGTVIPKEPQEVPQKMEKKSVEGVNAPATIDVSLPAEAKLTINGHVSKSTAPRRSFVSPELQDGNDYFYTMRAEIVRDGRPVVETRRVVVRAGSKHSINFDFNNQGVASR